MLNPERNVMKAIKMNRFELLRIVRENRTKHVAAYNESLTDYAQSTSAIAKANVKIARENQKALAKFLAEDHTRDSSKVVKPPKSYLPYPTSYEDEYSRAIRMLELSVDEEILIEEAVFNQLVLDEWNWKRQFIMASGMYKTAGG